MSATLSDVREKSPAYQAGAFFGMARSVANRVVPAASIIVSLDEMLVRDLLQVMRSEKINCAWQKKGESYILGVCVNSAVGRWN